MCVCSSLVVSCAEEAEEHLFLSLMCRDLYFRAQSLLAVLKKPRLGVVEMRFARDHPERVFCSIKCKNGTRSHALGARLVSAHINAVLISQCISR